MESENSPRSTILGSLAALAAACLAAALIEGVLVGLTVPVATSDGLGFVAFMASAAATGFLAALPLVFGLVALGLLRRGRPAITAFGGAALFETCVTAALCVLALWGIERGFAALSLEEFPGHIAVLKLAIQGVAVACVVGFVRPLIAAMAERWRRVAPTRLPSGLSTLVVATLVAVAGLAFSHRVLAPVNLAPLAGLVTLGVLALLTFGGRPALAMLPPRARRGLATVALVFAGLGASWGAGDAHGRMLLHGHSASFAQLAAWLGGLADVDGDGAAPLFWLGGADCDEGNAVRGPGVREQPGDGIDQDCRGGDAPVLATGIPAASASVPLGLECLSKKERPSIVLVTLDAVRADRADPVHMPFLSALSRQSFTFARAYSPAAFTTISIAGILSGLGLSDLGAQNPAIEKRMNLGTTLPMRLQQAGYLTASFNYFELPEAFGSGFEAKNPHWADTHPHGIKSGLGSAALVEGALGFLDAAARKPTFVWIHLPDAHAPYLDPKLEGVPPGFTNYEREVAYLDTQLHHLVEGLARRDRFDSTIIAVTADHGEELGARSREGHGFTLFDGATRVPLVVRVPGCAPRVIAGPTSLLGLPATLARLGDVSMPGPVLTGAPPSAPTVVETTNDAVLLRAIIIDRYKLIHDVRGGGSFLFDINGDPDERRNLYRGQPDLAARLERAYQVWLDRPVPESSERPPS